MRRYYLFIPILLCANLVFAQNELTNISSNIKNYSTTTSIGVEWNITGDSNHNANCDVSYRVSGSTLWKDAKSLYRIDFESYNMLAGSVLFLDENTKYEVKLTLADPDGGAATQTIVISTKGIPKLPKTGNSYHVISGSGGGSGSQSDPFKGITSAQTIAQAGDIFLIHAGDYRSSGVLYFNQGGTINNYIVWKAYGDGDAVFSKIRLEANYLWFEGLKFVYSNTDNDYGLRTSPPGPIGVVLKANQFSNCHYCIFLNDGGSNWFITDNIIVGDNDPNQGSNFSGEGIELNHTSGHTVAYNRISRVADGISYPHSNVDIFNNDIFDTTDDGIEGDFGHSNIRIWGNRISNAYNNGISFQPMNGSPWYVLYNQIAAPGEDALKFRTRSDAVLLAHNTLIAWNGPVSAGSEFLKNIESKNNLWVSIEDRYIWEDNTDGATNWRTNLDYDGFDWGDNTYAFKWGAGVRLNDIPSFTTLTGQQNHGMRINRDNCFKNFNIPNPPPASIPFQHLSLKSSCIAIDAGITLANINDDHLGTAPDMGAYEFGKQPPHYGPRLTTTKPVSGLSMPPILYLLLEEQ